MGAAALTLACTPTVAAGGEATGCRGTLAAPSRRPGDRSTRGVPAAAKARSSRAAAVEERMAGGESVGADSGFDKCYYLYFGKNISPPPFHIVCRFLSCWCTSSPKAPTESHKRFLSAEKTSEFLFYVFAQRAKRASQGPNLSCQGWALQLRLQLLGRSAGVPEVLGRPATGGSLGAASAHSTGANHGGHSTWDRRP